MGGYDFLIDDQSTDAPDCHSKSPWLVLVADDNPEAYEEWVLAAAATVRQQRPTHGNLPPPYPEPKRSVVHWEHVMTEMEWIAKDFGRWGCGVGRGLEGGRVGRKA